MHSAGIIAVFNAVKVINCRNFIFWRLFQCHHLNLSLSIADLGSGAFFTSGSGSFFYPGIRDEQPGSYFRELGNNFFLLKYFNSLIQILDPGWKKFGSGINIPDPQRCP